MTRPRQFDLICFDWDGTLFDSTAIIVRCIQQAVVDVGGTMPSADAASYVIGMALTPALARAAPDVPPERYPELGARYRTTHSRPSSTTLACSTVCRLHAGGAEGPWASLAGRGHGQEPARAERCAGHAPSCAGRVRRLAHRRTKPPASPIR